MQIQKDTERILDSFKAVLLTYARKIKTRPQRYVLAPRGTQHVTITDCYKLHQIAKKQRAFMFTPDGIQQQKFMLVDGINLEDSQSGKALADKWRSTPEKLKSLMNDKILFHYVVQKAEVYKKRNGLRSIQLQGKMQFYQLDRPFDEQFEIYKQIIEEQDKQKNKIINLDDEEKNQLKFEDRQQLLKRREQQYKEPLKKMFALKRQQLLEQKKIKTKTQVVKQYPKQKFRQYRRKDANGQIVFLENAPKPRKTYKKKIDSDLDQDGQIVVSDHEADPQHGTVRKKKVKVAIVQDQNQYDFYKMDSYDQNERRPRKKSGPKQRKREDDQIEKARQRRRRLFANDNGFYQGETFNIENSLNESDNSSSQSSDNKLKSKKVKKGAKNLQNNQTAKPKRNRSYKKNEYIQDIDSQQLERQYLASVYSNKINDLKYKQDQQFQKKQTIHKDPHIPKKFVTFKGTLPNINFQHLNSFIQDHFCKKKTIYQYLRLQISLEQ